MFLEILIVRCLYLGINSLEHVIKRSYISKEVKHCAVIVKYCETITLLLSSCFHPDNRHT